MVPKHSCTPFPSVRPPPPLPWGTAFRNKAFSVKAGAKLLPAQTPSHFHSAGKAGGEGPCSLHCPSQGVPVVTQRPPLSCPLLCSLGAIPAGVPAPARCPGPVHPSPAGWGRGSTRDPCVAPSFRFVLLGLSFYIFLVSRVCVFSPPCYGSGAPC